RRRGEREWFDAFGEDVDGTAVAFRGSPASFEHAADDQRGAAAGGACVALPHGGRNHDVEQTGFVLQAEKCDTTRGRWPLPVRDNPGDGQSGVVGYAAKLGRR